MSTLQEKLQACAQGVEANLVNIQQEVSRTQGEVSRTQAGIQGLIETARSEGGSVLRPSQERDRQVFDPRDYNIGALPTTFSLGVWKKWRHEVEIYVDTIELTRKGVKMILQQARQSPTALETTKEAFRLTVNRARVVNKGVGPVDELFDYAAKASVLYRMLVPTLNLDSSTEFRNSSPDNGLELWRLLNRNLDPPRADWAFHWTNDLRKHARTNCVDFGQTVEFIAMLDGKCREFQVETGEALDPVILDKSLEPQWTGTPWAVSRIQGQTSRRTRQSGPTLKQARQEREPRSREGHSEGFGQDGLWC